jgi:hypothetical protein
VIVFFPESIGSPIKFFAGVNFQRLNSIMATLSRRKCPLDCITSAKIILPSFETMYSIVTSPDSPS